MLDITRFKQKKRICLHHHGESYFLGVDSLNNIYIEEYYDESYVAQHCMSIDGEIIASVDENFGKSDFAPLELPDDLIQSHHPTKHALNYTGLRYRGMREQEKVMEWVKPLPMMEKMPLIQALNLEISPMMIFGIAESRILAESKFSDTETIVCRRIQLLRALPDIQIDADGLTYDYDTITFHVIHAYKHETEAHLPLHQAIKSFPDIKHALDCMLVDSHLIIANGSDGEKSSEVHLFQLQENDPK